MHLTNIAVFKPEADSRAWLSIPHPTLPLIATASSDKKARIYSLQNFRLHSTLDGGHKRSVRSVAWKPNVRNGDLSIVTGSFDATAGIWRRGEQQAEERNTEIDFTNGASGDNDNADEEEHDWEFNLVLEGHDSEIKSVAFSPSGQFLATCSRDKSVWIWEEVGSDGEDEWETVAVLQDHEADVKFLCWTEIDGEERLASCSYDDTIRLFKFDEEDWTCVAVLNGHESTVLSIDWEKTDRSASIEGIERRPGDVEESNPSNPKPAPRIVSSSADQTIKIWSRDSPANPSSGTSSKNRIPSTFRPASSAETWICTATLPKAHERSIYSVSWSQKSGRIVSTGGDSQVIVYEERPETNEWIVVASLEMAHGLYEVNHAIWCNRFDGGRKGKEEMIVTTGDDGHVNAWSLDEDVSMTNGDGGIGDSSIKRLESMIEELSGAVDNYVTLDTNPQPPLIC